MGIVTPGNSTVLDYKGIHVYRMDISNCSGRVRPVLEEKGLSSRQPCRYFLGTEYHHIDRRRISI
jgi:hypothetical protein